MLREEAPWVLAAKTGKIGFANRLDVKIEVCAQLTVL
jgi:hypothetical protein